MGAEDAIEAERILRFALYKEVIRRRTKKKIKRTPREGQGGGGGEGEGSGESSDEDEDSGDEDEATQTNGTQNGIPKAAAYPGGSQDIEMAADPGLAATAPVAGLREDR